jgi:acetylornithine deacetylase/succinyl-diaminopimelate desuccinylase-like protein
MSDGCISEDDEPASIGDFDKMRARTIRKKELQMSQFEDAMSYVDQEAVANLTMEMIDIPSPMGGERALAEYLAGRFRAVGLQTKLQEVEPDRYNVFGKLEGTGGGSTLMYCGHLDTTYGGDEEGIRDLGPG